MYRMIFLSLLTLTSCFQTTNEDDDLRTVPVTNNPHVVPHYGNTLPGIGGGNQQGPY